MYPIHSMARPAREFVVARLEGLQLALHQLAGRLRDSIATLIGTHVGDAIGDAIRAALNRRLTDADDEDPNDYYGERSPYGQHGYEDHRSHWHDPEPTDRWRGREERNPSTPVPRPLPGWLPLVWPTLHGLRWLLGPLLARWPWLGALGVGTAAALAAVLFNPLAGVLTGSAGLALWMLRLADNFCATSEGVTHFFGR